ncbi:LOW QUALITY PROTEIN: protein MFI [Glossophaga mutica]
MSWKQELEFTKRDKAARVIQKAWKAYLNVTVFQHFKSLINIRRQGEPRQIVRYINPKEAELLDAAAGVHVRFRLGGVKFPPEIYYKIFTERHIEDLCANSPRDYTKFSAKYASHIKSDNVQEEDHSGWYCRIENNGWRPVSDTFWMSAEDVMVGDKKECKFHFSKLKRRQDMERKRKIRKIEWMKQIATDSKMSSGNANIGHPAPNFKATAVIPDGQFKDTSLTTDANMFFYQLYFTSVCPTDIIEEFKKLNCQVIGASVDSHFCYLAWINTPRKQGGLGSMNIPLVSDPKCTIADYGVLKADEGISFRGLFIIDEKGILPQITANNLPVGCSLDESLRLVQAFQFTDKHGEVCPAGWKPGSDAIRPDVQKSKEYFSKQKYYAGSLEAKSTNIETLGLIHTATKGLIRSFEDGGIDSVMEWEVDEVLNWTNTLNFDEYIATWKEIATSNSSDNFKSFRLEQEQRRKYDYAAISDNMGISENNSYKKTNVTRLTPDSTYGI